MTSSLPGKGISMRKFGIVLGLTFMLLGWGWEGQHSFGTTPAFGQPPPPPPGYYCDPYYYQCYYSEPYADPLSQFFYYYVVPETRGRERRREFREHRRHERFEHREHDRGRGRR